MLLILYRYPEFSAADSPDQLAAGLVLLTLALGFVRYLKNPDLGNGRAN